MIISQNIESSIHRYNPWYRKKDFLFQRENDYQKRKQYYLADKYLGNELIVSLLGIRRTGKSTIMKQLINSLLPKVGKTQLFFYQFDEGRVFLPEVLDFYFRNILRQDIYEAECFIFLDELQMVAGWQDVLKEYLDINPKIKFVISGSTHLHLHQNTRESLAGRITDLKIDPFYFLEWINFKYQKNYSDSLSLENIFKPDFLAILKEQSDLKLFRDDLKTFLSWGEFPYFFHENDFLELENYYRESILEKIFSHDVHYFDVKNFSAFFDLFKVLALGSAQEINLSNISREMALDKITIKRYIGILEKMFVYDYLPKYDRSFRKQTRAFKKGYLRSLVLLKTSLHLDFYDLDQASWGHIVETFVYNEIRKQNTNSNYEIFFYHDTKNKKEVDFIIRQGQKIVPIEVKASQKIQKKHLVNLMNFMEQMDIDRGILLYGGSEVESKSFGNKKIDCVPYFLV